jgi:hypothetical protein
MKALVLQRWQSPRSRKVGHRLAKFQPPSSDVEFTELVLRLYIIDSPYICTEIEDLCIEAIVGGG